MPKNDISKLINNGHYIGSQGRNHLNLNLINKSKLINEISTSKRNLEKMFNCKVNFFAYAFGAYNQRVIKEVKKYYDFALSVKADQSPGAVNGHWLGQGILKINFHLYFFNKNYGSTSTSII